MKKIVLINCLIFTFVIHVTGNPPEKKPEESGGNYSMATYQFTIPVVNYIYPEWGFYIEGSTGLSSIQNNNLSSEIWDLNGGLGFTFNAGYFRSFGPKFRIKAGLDLSYYSSVLKGEGFATQQLSDIDNDQYTETLMLSNVENKVNPIYLSIPLIIEFGSVNITRKGFYVNAGLKYSFLLMNNYQTSGLYSTSGTYEQWGVTLENIEELGFYSGRQLESEAEIGKNNLFFLVGTGISFPVSAGLIFKLGISGSIGLMDIGNNPPVKEDFSPITKEIYNFRAGYIDNSLAVKEGTKIRYIGLDFGIYINKLLK